MSDMTMTELHMYYRVLALESDAYADHEPEQRYERKTGERREDTIGVYTDSISAEFYVTPREARVLAWSLLAAAEKAAKDQT